MLKNAAKEQRTAANAGPLPQIQISAAHNTVKFEIFGEEMLEKTVQQSGRSGRIYLPPDWVGRRIKVIRLE